MQPVKIILDTDMGADCDDAGALALLHELANDGECEIAAVTHCNRGQHYANCIHAINRHYGRPHIPVGIFGDGDQDCFQARDHYAYEVGKCASVEAMHTVKLLRKTLVEANDGELVIAAIGPLYSLRRLLESGADEYSPCTGEELIRRKVRRTCVMGGHFSKPIPEYNIEMDILSAQEVCRRWPGELVFCGFEIGAEIITGAALEAHGNGPVAQSYRLFHQRNGMDCKGRESWDLATALYAVRPQTDLWTLHPWGEVTVDDRGVTVWHEKEKGRQSFLRHNAPARQIAGLMDRLLQRN